MKELIYKDFTVLVVEDEIGTREELEEFLSLYFGHVLTAKDGCEGLQIITEFNPNLVVTDIKMPCMSGLEMLQEAKKISRSSSFIFTTAFSDSKYLLEAIDNHAFAYLIKPISFNVLLGEISELLSEKRTDNRESKLLHNELSSREYEVFIDMTRGIKTQIIAEKYDIKPKTVSTYRTRILEKMCLNSNAELIKYAITNNLI